MRSFPFGFWSIPVMIHCGPACVNCHFGQRNPFEPSVFLHSSRFFFLCPLLTNTPSNCRIYRSNEGDGSRWILSESGRLVRGRSINRRRSLPSFAPKRKTACPSHSKGVRSASLSAKALEEAEDTTRVVPRLCNRPCRPQGLQGYFIVRRPKMVTPLSPLKRNYIFARRVLCTGKFLPT